MEVRMISPEEGRQLLDEAARKYLDISGEEFCRRYEAGEFRDPYSDNHANEIRVAMLRAFCTEEGA